MLLSLTCQPWRKREVVTNYNIQTTKQTITIQHNKIQYNTTKQYNLNMTQYHIYYQVV